MNNYFDECRNHFGDKPIVLFDDSDISKRYGKLCDDGGDVRYGKY